MLAKPGSGARRRRLNGPGGNQGGRWQDGLCSKQPGVHDPPVGKVSRSPTSITNLFMPVQGPVQGRAHRRWLLPSSPSHDATPRPATRFSQPSRRGVPVLLPPRAAPLRLLHECTALGVLGTGVGCPYNALRAHALKTGVPALEQGGVPSCLVGERGPGPSSVPLRFKPRQSPPFGFPPFCRRPRCCVSAGPVDCMAVVELATAAGGTAWRAAPVLRRPFASRCLPAR